MEYFFDFLKNLTSLFFYFSLEGLRLSCFWVCIGSWGSKRPQVGGKVRIRGATGFSPLLLSGIRLGREKALISDAKGGILMENETFPIVE